MTPPASGWTTFAFTRTAYPDAGADRQPGAQPATAGGCAHPVRFVARAARFMLHAQVEAGTLCPVTMTFGATPLLLQALPAEFRSG